MPPFPPRAGGHVAPGSSGSHESLAPTPPWGSGLQRAALPGGPEPPPPPSPGWSSLSPRKGLFGPETAQVLEWRWGRCPETIPSTDLGGGGGGGGWCTSKPPPVAENRCAHLSAFEPLVELTSGTLNAPRPGYTSRGASRFLFSIPVARTRCCLHRPGKFPWAAGPGGGSPPARGTRIIIIIIII